ncbi:hypothetical protein [Shewanella livingstonensis]|uniref:Uncharacterized protein n=1 Tax=Shewanella livingstonensis TaxID=150120 RepID=A0A3G8LYL0_9GAMM|nr:hypothetical protein [Shewanella livingstonensis]AZG74527.1 hypothetical protein EGC82_18325 [Shewanella livingstonensis]
MHIKIHRLLQSTRGKLVFVLSFVLMIFIVISVINRIANSHNMGHFDCHADGYFSQQGESSLTVNKSDLWLTLDIDHHDAKLTYRLESSNSTEIAQLVGKVKRVDMGSFTYYLILTILPVRWQDNSRLHPYLRNEFGILPPQSIDGISVSQQVQVIDLDHTLTSATLKFLPSNNIWACQLISANTSD